MKYILINKRSFLHIVFLFVIVLLQYGYTLSAENIPIGDAKRVLPYVEFVDHSGEFHPLWNPNIFGGVPVLADPERFIFLSKFINSDSPFRMFQLNILMFLFVFGGAIAFYIFVKQWDVSADGSFVSAVVYVTSGFVMNALKSGRINNFQMMILLPLLFWAYKNYVNHHRDQRYWLIMILGFGFTFTVMGYYSVILLFLPISIIGMFADKEYARNAVKVLQDGVLFSIGGVLVYSVFLLPLIDYSIANISNLKPINGILDNQAMPGDIINMMFPLRLFINDIGVLYISVWLLAAFVVFWESRHKQVWQYFNLFALLFLISLTFLLGKLYPFRLLVQLFDITPVLNQIRWTLSFQYLLLLTSSIFIGAAYDRMFKIDIPASIIIRNSLIILIGLFVILISIDVLSVGKMSISQKLNLSTVLNVSGVVFILPFLLAGIPWYLNSKRFTVFIFLLFIVYQSAFFYSYYKDKRAGDQLLQAKVSSNIESDHDYFSVYIPGHQLGIPHINDYNGFSMYFSSEYRFITELIKGCEVDELRPHWVRLPHILTWRNWIIDALNIKYVLVPNNVYRKLLIGGNGGWVVAASVKGQKLLRREKFASHIILYDKWKVENEPGLIKKGLFELSGRSEYVFINVDPGIDLNNTYARVLEYSQKAFEKQSSKITIDIEVNKFAILVLPEIYDRYWQVRVNEQDGKVLKANGAFRAVVVAPGKNHIEFYYYPTMFYIGLVISIISFFLLVVYYIYLSFYVKNKVLSDLS